MVPIAHGQNTIFKIEENWLFRASKRHFVKYTTAFDEADAAGNEVTKHCTVVILKKSWNGGRFNTDGYESRISQYGAGSAVTGPQLLRRTRFYRFQRAFLCKVHPVSVFWMQPPRNDRHPGKDIV